MEDDSGVMTDFEDLIEDVFKLRKKLKAKTGCVECAGNKEIIELCRTAIKKPIKALSLFENIKKLQKDYDELYIKYQRVNTEYIRLTNP
ncbi:11727_t:CDS:1, partial [Dentiscutata erythropus]